MYTLKILFTKERAELLDKILTSATDTNRIVKLEVKSSADKNEYISAGQDLKKLNLGKWLGGGNFMVYPEGLSFISKHPFTQLYKAKLRQDRKEKIYFCFKLIAAIAAVFGIIFGFIKACS